MLKSGPCSPKKRVSVKKEEKSSPSIVEPRTFMAPAAKDNETLSSRDEDEFRRNQEMYQHLAYSRDHFQLKAYHWFFLLTMGTATIATLVVLILSYIPTTKKYVFQVVDLLLGL